MIKFKSERFPEPSIGLDLSKEPDLLVPDQSLSLEDILQRFTRNEALPVGREVNYGSEESNIPFLNMDLEKMGSMDLTEKAEYYEALKGVTVEYEKQERKKAAQAAEQQRLKDEAALQRKIRLEAKKLRSKGSSEKLA